MRLAAAPRPKSARQLIWPIADWAFATINFFPTSSRAVYAIPTQTTTTSPPLPPQLTPMASRRLALNLTRGLRSRAAIDTVTPLRRGFATPVIKNGVKTETTTLSNGLTVRRTGIDIGQLLMWNRLRPSTPRGPRRRQSVSGSMPDLEQRRIEPMAPPTSWSTLLSRYGWLA